MASKRTFIYRVHYGYADGDKHIVFCYARNAICAIKYYKDKFKEQNYNYFKATMIGEANSSHKGKFEEMADDEQECLRRIRGETNEKYSFKNDLIPAGAEYIAIEDMNI